MKRSEAAFLFIFMFLFFLGLPSVALAAVPADAAATIRVGSDHDYPPYEFNDRNGNPTGFNVELIRAVCEAAGLQAKIRLGVWNEVRTDLEKGEIDVIAGMYHSPDRARTLGFSLPHNMVSPALFVRDNSDIETFDQARSREIAVQKGDIMHDYLVEKNFTLRIVTVDDPVKALTLLAGGSHDGVLLSSRIQGLYFIERQGLEGIRVVDTPLSPRPYCFAVRKDREDLVQKLNEGLTALKLTGQYDDIYKKWFGVYEQKNWAISREFMAVFAVILALLAVISCFSWFLRIQVKKKTRELLISERRYRHLVQNASDILSVSSVQGDILYINPVVERILGYSQAEMTGRRFYEFIHPDHLDQVKEFYKDQFRTKTAITYHEFPVVKKDSEVIWLGQNAQLLENGNEMRGFQAIARDITERVRGEEERKQLTERLQRAEKMEALGTLAGGVAHDLNNVLGILVGYSELLLDDIPENNPLRDHVVHIMNGGMRAAAIVQDLLTMARRGVQADDVINLNAVIADFVKTPECAALCSRSPNIRLRTELAPALLNIRGSAPHLFKTLLNLLTNAVEAMPHGGLVTVSTANSHLEKPVQGYDSVREGDYVVLTVSDTGQGITAEDVRHIFEPFYTKKVMGRSGTGLGLAVVWGTVKDHNGYIDVQSEPGQGSTFTLYLPVTRDEIQKPGDESGLPDLTGKGQAILVVDDVKEQRELAERMLARLNYKVSTAASGEDALAMLPAASFDLVILDMIMDPGMDGLDTYREILKIRPGQRAIIVSGFSSTDRVAQAIALGAGDYVKKPYMIETLGAAVKRELEKPR